MSRTIATFFYGSFMDRQILNRLDIAIDASEPAMLSAFQIELRPRVNLYRSDRHVVYGAVMNVTHADLSRLYGLGQHELRVHGVTVPDGQAGGVYLPEPVVVTLRDGLWRPAICYIAERQVPTASTNEYVDSVVAAARTLKLPEWYVEHLSSFATR